MDIHNYDKIYQKTLESVKQANISKRNKELIFSMVNDLVLKNISKPRLVKYLGTLKLIAMKLGKDLDKATEEDLKKFIGEIQQKNYSVWTKGSYKIVTRKFYQWLHGMNGKEFPEIVKWISIHISKSEKKLPSSEELMTEDDIHKILSATKHPRDRALVSLLWETGCRIGELGNLHIKNVIFDKYGAMLAVQGKTGARKVRVIASTPFLSTWIDSHPHRDNKDAPLWVCIGNVNHGKPISYRGIRQHLQRLCDSAGVNKRCNPHSFRHSRATFMAHHLTEFQMNQYFGWIQGSDMPATYVHMSGKNVDNAILKMNGFAIEEDAEKQKLQPKKCPRCTTINGYDSSGCIKCGCVLDIQEAMAREDREKEYIEKRAKLDGIMDKLADNPKFWNFVQETLG